MVLSTGGATADEIDQTLKWIGEIVPATEMRKGDIFNALCISLPSANRTS